MYSIINRQNVKRLALEMSAAKRAGKFTRVSAEFIDRIEGRLKQFIASEVHQHPSIGKTLK
jgi:hypothetical protein